MLRAFDVLKKAFEAFHANERAVVVVPFCPSSLLSLLSHFSFRRKKIRHNKKTHQRDISLGFLTHRSHRYVFFNAK